MGKKGKGKGKGKKGQKVADGLKPAEQSRVQLLGFIQRLQAEMVREREERNFYMLEREKMFQMWNLLMERIALEREKAALLDAHLQEVEKMKEGEEDLYERKLRFLKQEHTRRIGQVRLHHLTLMKHIQDDTWLILLIMRETWMGKRRDVRQHMMAFYQTIRSLYWKHAKEVSELRRDFAREIRRLETSFDRRLFEGNDKKEEEQERRLSTIAKNKEIQVEMAIESHRYQVKELTTFFRDSIKHNLTLIYGMKDAAKKEKNLELRAKKEYDEFKGKYDRYVSSALQWKKDMQIWEIEHANDNPQALARELSEATEECRILKETLRVVECTGETLQQRIDIARKETDCLQKSFTKAIVDIQKKASMNRFVQEVKKRAAKREGEFLESLADNIEKTQEDDTNYFESLMSGRDRDLAVIRTDIVEHAHEHKSIEDTYKEQFLMNEINLADIGFPIKKTGIKIGRTGHEEDMFSTNDDNLEKEEVDVGSVKSIVGRVRGTEKRRRLRATMSGTTEKKEGEEEMEIPGRLFASIVNFFVAKTEPELDLEEKQL